MNLSELNKWNDRFRFDSEFVKKEYLALEKILQNKNHKLLANTDCKILHPSEIKREYVDEESGVWFFRAQNVRPLKIEDSNNVFISKKDAKRLSKNLIKKHDVVITRTGANFGQTALYNLDKTAIGSSHTFILRNSYFNQSFLAVFFNTNYGRKLIDKGTYGGSQPEIAPYYLSHIPIPEFSNNFQKQIENCLLRSEEYIHQSKKSYTQAESLLLKTLGLENFKPSQAPVNIKSFKDSFGASGRLDAEYYQMRYEDYGELIRSYSNGFELLHQVCEIKDANFNSSDKQKYKYIELADIGKSGEVTGCTYDVGSALPTRARRKVNTNDVVISSIAGSLESCALITADYDNALCSTGFYVLTSEKLNPETLLVLFKSEPLQNILKKGCSGTILTAIGKSELERVPIPIVEKEIQKQFQDKITESFTLKKQSEHLLTTAKRAVEAAIEGGEAAGVGYIVKGMEGVGEGGI
ncbi:MAG: restriction endonuclease subunit S [Ekhidna sp.]|nr:restriction endonuclease subunit S [Ekhidna sp.]